MPLELACRQQQVVFLNGNDNLVKAFNILESNHIISAPVWSETEKKFVGIVGYVDFVSLAIALYTQQPNLSALNSNYFKTLLKNAVNLSKRNEFHPMTEGTSLYEIVSILSVGIHRVPIVDANDSNKIVNIITQSGVIQFLAKNIEKLGARAKMTVQELGVGLEHSVIKINQSQPAIEAFKIMDEKQVSAAAIVDDKNVLINTISVTDIKYLAIEEGRKFRSLISSVLDYIGQVRQNEPQDPVWEGKTRFPAIHCYPEYTLEKVILKLASTRVHRLFIVDHDHHPIGVISLRDIMQELVRRVDAH